MVEIIFTEMMFIVYHSRDNICCIPILNVSNVRKYLNNFLDPIGYIRNDICNTSKKNQPETKDIIKSNHFLGAILVDSSLETKLKITYLNQCTLTILIYLTSTKQLTGID